MTPLTDANRAQAIAAMQERRGVRLEPNDLTVLRKMKRPELSGFVTIAWKATEAREHNAAIDRILAVIGEGE